MKNDHDLSSISKLNANSLPFGTLGEALDLMSLSLFSYSNKEEKSALK